MSICNQCSTAIATRGEASVAMCPIGRQIYAYIEGLRDASSILGDFDRTYLGRFRRHTGRGFFAVQRMEGQR